MIYTVKTNLFWLVICTILSVPLRANDQTLAYIRQYKTIVINEMDRVGIPASIKMAQAILESASGRSTLARQSKNHFGIKCGNNWEGDAVYRHDDDYKNGLLVRSCFRAFSDPEESFIAHSEFLEQNNRYAFLFELDPYDYKSWARGLRKAGYATDPNYPRKLIDLVERYELYLLDLGINDDEAKPLIAMTGNKPGAGSSGKTDKSMSKEPIIITAPKPVYASLKYQLKEGYYTFKQGDKMSDIAKHFRIDTKELYFKNRLAYGATPRPGQKLAVRQYIHFKDLPNTIDADSHPDQDFLFEEKITLSSL